MLQPLTLDNIYNLINSMDYPEIRRLCLTNRGYNHICTRDPEIQTLIAQKLATYVDLILNSMINVPAYID